MKHETDTQATNHLYLKAHTCKTVVEPIMKHKQPLKANKPQCLFLLYQPQLFIDCSQFISIQKSLGCCVYNYLI